MINFTRRSVLAGSASLLLPPPQSSVEPLLRHAGSLTPKLSSG